MWLALQRKARRLGQAPAETFCIECLLLPTRTYHGMLANTQQGHMPRLLMYKHGLHTVRATYVTGPLSRVPVPPGNTKIDSGGDHPF
jgi:hypothetical protein